jgi:hypothetical protein
MWYPFCEVAFEEIRFFLHAFVHTISRAKEKQSHAQKSHAGKEFKPRAMVSGLHPPRTAFMGAMMKNDYYFSEAE